MKKTFYEIIVKHLLPSTGGQDCASELAEMMTAFVEWKHYHVGFSNDYMGKKYTPNKLFLYWYENIYKK